MRLLEEFLVWKHRADRVRYFFQGVQEATGIDL